MYRYAQTQYTCSNKQEIIKRSKRYLVLLNAHPTIEPGPCSQFVEEFELLICFSSLYVSFR